MAFSSIFSRFPELVKKVITPRAAPATGALNAVAAAPALTDPQTGQSFAPAAPQMQFDPAAQAAFQRAAEATPLTQGQLLAARATAPGAATLAPMQTAPVQLPQVPGVAPPAVGGPSPMMNLQPTPEMTAQYRVPGLGTDSGFTQLQLQLLRAYAPQRLGEQAASPLGQLAGLDQQRYG